MISRLCGFWYPSRFKRSNRPHVLSQKTLGVFVFILVFAFSFLLYTYTRTLTGTRPVYAAKSTYLNFQGRLLNSSGGLVSDGYYNMQFNIYTVSSGGSAAWTETRDYNGGAPDNRVRVVNGYFSVNLGSVTDTLTSSGINWDQEHWLGMTVRGSSTCSFAACTPADSEMTPRTKLTAVPYAFKAESANNVTTNNTNAASTNSDSITIQSGNAAGTTSNSGSISIDVGTATGTRGSIFIGTTNSANAITIGSTTQTTAITIGQSAATNTISIGASVGSSATQTINLGTSATASSTTNVTIGSTVAGLTTLQSQGGIAITTLGTADTATYVCRNSSNILASCNTTGTGAGFVQGGNSFGATAVLGTNDSYNLEFETNGTTRWYIDTNGHLVPNANDTYDIGTNTSRVRDIYAGPGTVHIGTSTTDEGNISYNTTTNNLTFDATNGSLFKNTANSISAFQIQNTSGSSLFTADTKNTSLTVGGNVAASTSASQQSTSDVTTTIASIASNDVGAYSAIAIGADGLPVIGYKVLTGTNAGEFYVVKCTSTDCSSSSTATLVEGASPASGAHDSVTIGRDGYPIFAYKETTNNDQKTLKCTTPDCSGTNTITTIQSSNNSGNFNSIVIAPDGLPIMASSMLTSGNYSLQVTKCGNSACSSGNTTTTVDNSVTSIGGWSSIAIGADGYAVISYKDVTNGDLVIAKCSNATCSSSTKTSIDTTNNTGGYTAIGIGADGLPVVAYNDATAGTLKVLKCGNNACTSSNTITTVETVNLIDTKMTIGRDGLPIIVYTDNTNTRLRVAKCGNAACSSGNTFTNIDTGIANNGNTPSIAIGNDGLPIISYRDITNGVLRVTRCGNTACSGAGTTLTGGLSIGSANASFQTGYIQSIRTADNINPFTIGTNAIDRLYIAGNGDVTFKNTTSATAFQIQDASSVSQFLVDTSSSSVTIGSTTSTGTITLGQSTATNTINIGTVAGASATQTINIGTSSTASSITNVTVGSTIGTSTTTLRSGTGDLLGTSTDAILFDATGVLELNSSGGVISIGNDAVAQAINVGTGAAARTITVGNTTGATALNLRSGTGNFTLDGVTGTTYTLGASTTTGTITIGGTAQTGNIVLGSSSGSNTLAIANGSGATTLNIANTQNAGSVNIGAGMTTGTITIGGTGAQTGTISIGTGTGAQSLNFGTGGTGAKTVTVGSTASTGATTIQSGSGNIIFQVAGSSTTGNVQVGSGAGSATPDLLVLDNKNTSGDPTGTAGALYYNSNSSQFRCYTSSWSNCVATTLQGVYDADADGSDSIITLSTADDGVIIRNPSSSGSDSTYNLVLDQLSTGAKGGLSIQSAGTGNLILVSDTTATAADVFTIADQGVVTFKSQTNNTTAFSIQNASGTGLFKLDSSIGQVRLGTGSSGRLTLEPLNGGTTNLWNIDNNAGTFRIYRENWAATGTGAGGAVKLSITDAGNADFSNNVAISGILTVDNGGTGQYIDDPDNVVHIGATGNTNNLVVHGTGTTCTIGSGTGATNCTSDQRLKTNVATLGGSLNKILQLRPTTFNWADPSKPGTKIGLIAQEVQQIFPGFVNVVDPDSPEQYLGVDYAALVTPLIGAVQEQQAQLAELQAGNFANINVSNLATVNNLVVNNNASFRGNITVSGHIITAGNAPSVSVLGASGTATNGATITVAGTDTSGTITITTANTGPLSTGQLAKVIFDKTYSVTPNVVITPIGSLSAELEVYVEPSTTQFIIGSNMAPKPGKVYKFSYHSIQ